MSSRRFLGVALSVFLLATTFTLAQGPSDTTSVLGEGASIDPHTFPEISPPAPDQEASLEGRLGETTTTLYVKSSSTTTTQVTATSSPTTDETGSTTTSPPSESSPTTTAPSPTTTVLSGGYNSGYESSFASEINSLRAANGLAGLSRNGSLDAEARAWSKFMAEQASLSHSGIGRLIPPWSSVAENVGTGPSVSAIFNALAGSPTHLDHMLGSYEAFGVGVWVDSNGILWTTHIFAK